MLRSARFYEYNPAFDEVSYALRMHNLFVQAGFNPAAGMLIDTSRNGWGGTARPSQLDASGTTPDVYANTNRYDRRLHRGNWCNQSGAGMGYLPQANPYGLSQIHALLWVKPPGESDGTSTPQNGPDGDGKNYDPFCNPAFATPNGTLSGALPDAPTAGNWFDSQFRQLVQNAWPPLPAPLPPDFVAQHGPLGVVDGRLVDEAGVKVQLRGMSSHGLQWFGQYMNLDALRWLRDDWGSNVIRAAMYTEEGGYIQNPAVKQRVFDTIDAAIALGMYVIVDWHILNDNDPNLHINEAKAFFAEVAQRYPDVPNILYEIANEPNSDPNGMARYNVTWQQHVKPYAQQVIAHLREYAPKSVVLVGTPTWSQDVDVAANDPLDTYNVMYTLHFYACTHGQSLRDKLSYARSKGIGVFVSEFGTTEATGGGQVCLPQAGSWLDFLDDDYISWANWSLSTANESSAALTNGASSAGGWRDSNLTTSGAFVRARMLQAREREGMLPRAVLPRAGAKPGLKPGSAPPLQLAPWQLAR